LGRGDNEVQGTLTRTGGVTAKTPEVTTVNIQQVNKRKKTETERLEVGTPKVKKAQLSMEQPAPRKRQRWNVTPQVSGGAPNGMQYGN